MSLRGLNGTLLKAEEIYQDRSRRAKELRKEGKRVMGYFCSFVPVELIIAADFVPYRAMGDINEMITEADAHLETMMCPFVRSCFDLALKGEYDFFDGFVMTHACDAIVKTYPIWRHHRKSEYMHFIDVPHMVRPSSFEFFKNELITFKRSLEEFIDREISAERISEAIRVCNHNRALLRKLYDLRKPDPPLVSGGEMMKVIIAGLRMPVEAFNELLSITIEDVESRQGHPEQKAVRLLIYGSEIGDASLIELIEECGANVVIDDLCWGTRNFWHDVEISEDPFDGLAEHYLGDITCPRTHKERTGTHQQDLENRFGYLMDLARDFTSNGAIVCVNMCCDTFEMDAPDVKDYLQSEDLPVLRFEFDYSVASFQQLRTRIQAFVEMITSSGL